MNMKGMEYLQITTKYPNLYALAHGCVSGEISKWPRLQTEALQILQELKKLKGFVYGLRFD